MPQQSGGGTGAGGTNNKGRDRSVLKEYIDTWLGLRDEIAHLIDRIEETPNPHTTGGENNPDYQRLLDQLERMRRERAGIVDQIQDIVEENPQLYRVAVRSGFREDLLPGADGDRGGAGKSGRGGEDEAQGGGGGGVGGGGGGGGANTRAQARDNRLLDGGKLVRGPKGTYAYVYTYKIGGRNFRVALTLGKDPDRLSRYGLKAADARQLTKAQMKKIENIGLAEEVASHIRKGDKDVFDSLVRYLNNQYEGQSILKDKEVMATVIANSMFGWSAGEFENQLRNTKWWKNTEAYQRDWQTTMSPKARKNAINRMTETVVNDLEDNFGLEWVKHVGGMDQAKKWAERIASGVWGDPSAGLEYWRDKMFDRARKIEGTPAWVAWQSEQEDLREFGNRPEEMFERLRSEAMQYLGQSNGKPLVDRATLMDWATRLSTKKATEHDWANFLRRQMKNLHPYFDENVAFTQQASPYKAIYESIHGTTTDWDNKFLKSFHATDDSGKPLRDSAMTLHDYELMLRDPDRNPDAYNDPGTQLWKEGMSLLDTLTGMTLGVR